MCSLHEKFPVAPKTFHQYIPPECRGGVNWDHTLDTVSILARFKAATQLEVAEAIIDWWNVKIDSGTVKRHWALMKHLPEIFILDAWKYIGSSKLGLIRLNHAGKDLARLIENQEPVENDWERMIIHHKAEQQHVHTTMTLGAARQARRRWLNVDVAPNPCHGLEPDLLIWEDMGIYYYAEVERGEEEDKIDKWRNYQKHVGDGVWLALVAATPAKRRTYVDYIKKYVERGVASDLASLTQQPDPPEDDAWEYDGYWMERWDTKVRSTPLQGK